MKKQVWPCLIAIGSVLADAQAQLPSDAHSSALFEQGLAPNGPQGEFESSALPDGFEVRVKRAGATPYTVQVQTGNSRVPIHVGDVLFVTFECRSPSVGGGSWQMYAQQSSPPWTGYFTKQGLPDGQWRRFNVHWKADKEIPVGGMGITFHVASMPQDLQFRAFEAVDLGRYTGTLPVTRITYAGREPGASWRKQAEQQIDRYRKADLTVKVVDKTGRPIRGARVHIRQLQHAYEFGSFVEQPLLWQNGDGEHYREWFLKAYNKATTPMYWADWGWENREEHARYLQYPEWLKQHGIRTKAHVLIYPGWQFMPSRVRKLEHDPQALWNEMERHIREKLAAVKQFGFVSWDVTNETRDLTDLPKTFGSEEVYVRLFKLMHSIDPSPRLFLNENTILTNGGKTEAQQNEYERMLRFLLSRGAPLQGIGMQAHFGDSLTPPVEIWRIVDRFAKLGLPIQITEFDLPIEDDKAQADYTRDLLTAWFAHPATTGFTMWGFWEGSMWQPAGALVAKNWKVNPNGQAWLELVTKRWWTDTTVITNAQGQATARVFKGNYELEQGTGKKQLSVLSASSVTFKN